MQMICSNNKICPVSTYKFGTRFFSLQGDGYFRIKLSELAINPGRFVGARKNHLVHAVFLAEWGDLEVFYLQLAEDRVPKYGFSQWAFRSRFSTGK